MARINVEDDVLRNPRFQALTRRLNGDVEKALGRLLRFWWAAQRHWVQDRQLIPLEEFRLGDFDGIVEVGLGEIRADGVYARGAERHFAWYESLLAGAVKGGRKSAETRRSRHGSAIPPNATNSPKASRTEPSEKSEGQPNRGFGEGASLPNALTLTLTPALKKKSKPPNDFDAQLAGGWADHARAVIPSIKVNAPAWAKAIRDLRVLDGLSESEIAATLDWIKRDDFWRQNAVSPVGLRKPSRNGLRKIDNIRLAMAKGVTRPATSSAKVLTSEDLNDL